MARVMYLLHPDSAARLEAWKTEKVETTREAMERVRLANVGEKKTATGRQRGATGKRRGIRKVEPVCELPACGCDGSAHP